MMLTVVGIGTLSVIVTFKTTEHEGVNVSGVWMKDDEISDVSAVSPPDDEGNGEVTTSVPDVGAPGGGRSDRIGVGDSSAERISIVGRRSRTTRGLAVRCGGKPEFSGLGYG